MALFESARHETLIDTAWDEARAQGAIARIVAGTNAAFSDDGLWPIHPFDVSPERPPDCLKMLYNGAAGTIWALHRLDTQGFAPLTRDYLPAVRSLAARHRADIEEHAGVRDYVGTQQGAYLFGETGLHLLEWKLAPSAEVADKLHAAIESRIGDVRGLVWGGAGAMLAALFLHEQTGDARWRDLFARHADALWEQWTLEPEFRCHLWTSDLYGTVEKRLGALHGYLANVAPLLRGIALLPAGRQLALQHRIDDWLTVCSVPDGAQRNWPNNAEALKRSEPPRLFVQHCNGPPGVINVLSDLRQGTALDEILSAAGELIWQAGPLTKLPSLCHGTPGNGFAFLKLHARTGDAKWLDRARCFAMHAIAQSEAALARYGQRKFSLWTGDLGLALYLAACVRSDAEFPTLDYF